MPHTSAPTHTRTHPYARPAQGTDIHEAVQRATTFLTTAGVLDDGAEVDDYDEDDDLYDDESVASSVSIYGCASQRAEAVTLPSARAHTHTHTPTHTHTHTHTHVPCSNTK